MDSNLKMLLPFNSSCEYPKSSSKQDETTKSSSFATRSDFCDLILAAATARELSKSPEKVSIARSNRRFSLSMFSFSHFPAFLTSLLHHSCKEVVPWGGRSPVLDSLWVISPSQKKQSTTNHTVWLATSDFRNWEPKRNNQQKHHVFLSTLWKQHRSRDEHGKRHPRR